MAKARVGQVFGGTIRQLRLERQWTQEDLADAAGLTTTYVGQVERGQKVPSLTVILQLALALRRPPEELLKGFTPAFMRSLKI